MGLDFAYPDSAKVGGLASGSMTPGENALFLDQEVFTSGAVGLALQGNVRVDTVVAQGCRPIGKPMTITRCEQQHLLMEVDGRNPMEVLTEIYHTLSSKDQDLMQNALHVGVASTELQESFKPGDFLIRNLMGIDQKQGILVVNEELQNGQTIQFHVRDAETAGEDLNHMLARYGATSPDPPPAGALLFSCQGRGQYLYGRTNHDSDAFVKALGRVPLGGFFCAGEIGPVARSTHIHGFTSAFGIFRPFAK
jgi:small ligand-binding sensory domain FIST